MVFGLVVLSALSLYGKVPRLVLKKTKIGSRLFSSKAFSVRRVVSKLFVSRA